MASHTIQKRPVIFGEVLFDCFPDGSQVLGGAPFNVAWHLQAFGAAPLLISRIGDDALGQSIATAMQNWGMDSRGLQMDTEHPTGTVDISFSGNEHSFNIVDHSAYDYIDTTSLPQLPENYLTYHGSLALRHEGSRQTLDHIRQLNGSPVFIDINLRSPWWQADDISKLLEHATWMKLNEDELDIIIPDSQDLDEQIEQLRLRYPAELFIITLGEKGAIAIERSGVQTSITPQGQQQVVDTVGAGDAFSSVLLLGIIKGWPLAVILERAQSFASAITGIRGATTTEQDFYTPFIRAWHL
jgi:fructokinase